MKQTTRELLVTTKVAESWEQNFDSNVDKLMFIVSKIDTVEQVGSATELLDVYHSKSKDLPMSDTSKKDVTTGRPFEFTVFKN